MHKLRVLSSVGKTEKALRHAVRGVEAGRAGRKVGDTIGAGPLRIVLRHLLPNMLEPLLIYAVATLSGAIWLTSGLSFLGLGPQPPAPEWGAMLRAGLPHLRDAWWVAGLPALAIFVSVLALTA